MRLARGQGRCSTSEVRPRSPLQQTSYGVTSLAAMFTGVCDNFTSVTRWPPSLRSSRPTRTRKAHRRREPPHKKKGCRQQATGTLKVNQLLPEGSTPVVEGSGSADSSESVEVVDRLSRVRFSAPQQSRQCVNLWVQPPPYGKSHRPNSASRKSNMGYSSTTSSINDGISTKKSSPRHLLNRVGAG